MKKYLILLLFCPAGLLAQKLKPLTYYSSDKQVSKEAKKFFKKLPVYQKDHSKYYTDPDIETITGSILDSMSTANSRTRPFYFYLVNRNSELFDGGLQLLQCIRQYDLLLKSPEYFFQYMLDNPKEKDKYMKGWYDNILIYLVQADECRNEFAGEEAPCLKSYREKVTGALKSSSTPVKDLAVVFFENNSQ